MVSHRKTKGVQTLLHVNIFVYLWKIESDVRHSYYFPSWRREKQEFHDDDLSDILGDNTVEIPVLLIDAHCRSSAWFNVAENFGDWFQQDFYVSIKGVSHEDIMFHEKHVQKVESAIRAFIRFVRGASSTLTIRALENISTCW